MTDIDSKPVRPRYLGEVYKQKLAEGDDPVVIAKRLTLAIWRSNTGGDASGGFNRKLSYRDARDADRLSRNLLSVADLFLYVPPRIRGGGA
jgi:hypothetical protein